MHKTTKIGLAVAGLAGVLAFATPLGANAASQITSAMIKDQTVESRDIAAGGVGTSEVRNQSLQSGDIAEGGVGASEVRNGSLTSQDLNPATAKTYLLGKKADADNAAQDEKIEALEAEGDDVGATVGAHLGSDATPIAKIGGSFAANATLLDTQHLSAGKYLVNTYAFFDRVDNGQASSPVLQVAVRGADGSTWGADYGTAFTGEFPATGNLEQTASSTRYVTVPEGGLDVSVYGFGYNADQSANGSGNYTVTADVSFVPVVG